MSRNSDFGSKGEKRRWILMAATYLEISVFDFLAEKVALVEEKNQ